MTEISASEVMSLRQKTGVSMMACKKALLEAKGDMAAAEIVLRKQGEAKAASKRDRVTSEGAIAISGNTIISVRCETDFVARNEDFLTFVQDLASEGAKNGAKAVESKFEAGKTEKIAKIGENLTLGDVRTVDAPVLGGYVHSNRKIGALIGLSGGTKEVAADIAMHVTAMNPLVLSPNDVSNDLVEKEKEIWRDQLKNEGKPAEIVEKIMMGKERKFREESALIAQAFVKDQQKTVGEYAKQNGAEVKAFARVEV
ncbi:translation elongation factor Ts [Candidatus Peregrinibacteria bacterium]|nr:translation elongation factor Ts [Candidatus Peregrinibacteria bacterium]